MNTKVICFCHSCNKYFIDELDTEECSFCNSEETCHVTIISGEKIKEEIAKRERVNLEDRFNKRLKGLSISELDEMLKLFEGNYNPIKDKYL